ncbi:hypothetical protein PTKIN_Ptkin14bG0184900 [Pterospermum kingtungense]
MEVVDLIKLRLANWIKAKWSESTMCISELLSHPQLFKAPGKSVLPKLSSSWMKPPAGFVKFNVDGSSVGKPGMSESNMAELMAVREAIILFLSSKWVEDCSVITESDSKNVISWMKKTCSVPWRMRPVFNHIQNLLVKLKSWDIVHVLRECNMVADSLAKEGVHRKEDLVSINEQ